MPLNLSYIKCRNRIIILIFKHFSKFCQICIMNLFIRFGQTSDMMTNFWALLMIEVTWVRTHTHIHTSHVSRARPRVSLAGYIHLSNPSFRSIGSTQRNGESMRSSWISGLERETHFESRKFVESTSLKQSNTIRLCIHFPIPKQFRKKTYNSRQMYPTWCWYKSDILLYYSMRFSFFKESVPTIVGHYYDI